MNYYLAIVITIFAELIAFAMLYAFRAFLSYNIHVAYAYNFYSYVFSKLVFNFHNFSFHKIVQSRRKREVSLAMPINYFSSLIHNTVFNPSDLKVTQRRHFACNFCGTLCCDQWFHEILNPCCLHLRLWKRSSMQWKQLPSEVMFENPLKYIICWCL